MSLPKMAYILLWFPKPSETFIFREVVNLRKMGLSLKVFALYGELKELLSPEMTGISTDVERLGSPHLLNIPEDVRYWRRRDPVTTSRLFRTIPMRRWSSLEVCGENIWAFFCGFRLAKRFEEEGIEHIHAPWANGPATAAWVASRLARIPFSFSGRAGDIYPPDGALHEKIKDATFIRTNTRANVEYLKGFTEGDADKIHLIYNGHTLEQFSDAPVPMKPPYRILALGRFARSKGYDVLLRAGRIMEDSGVPFHINMVGAGPRALFLKALRTRLRLGHRVSFPGFVSHDRVPGLFHSSDILVMPCVVHRTGDRDGIPNVIMEALLHRVPVVASDVSGIGEVIEHEKTGLLVSQRDPQGLADTILRMIGDRRAALEMAERGKARVMERFDPEKNHKRVLKLYADLCRRA